ncbi:hypothetical protein PoB_001533400 [Plakobranchus ocellatus]|uniref:Uncharacterized protein n=1 Tax=Plakobranchus ocellatus TaxID=259542 RepID=A0AAV3Z0I0_9GAST|nr:hypothetical protein PoB_001533400 [Plakobranchus ocellatus]
MPCTEPVARSQPLGKVAPNRSALSMGVASSPLQGDQGEEPLRYLKTAGSSYSGEKTSNLASSQVGEGHAETSGSQGISRGHTVVKRFTEFVGKRDQLMRQHKQEAASNNMAAWDGDLEDKIHDMMRLYVHEMRQKADRDGLMQALHLSAGGDHGPQLRHILQAGNLGRNSKVFPSWLDENRQSQTEELSQASHFPAQPDQARSMKRYAEFLGKRSEGPAEDNLSAILRSEKNLGQLLAQGL